MTFSAKSLCILLVVQAAFALSPEKQSFLSVEGDGHGGKPKIQAGQDGKSKGKSWFPWEETKHHPSTRLQCGITEQVGADTDKYEDCPANCPYFAQNRKDTDHCTFLCVPGPECGRWNPLKPIPDSIKNTKTCRGPKVSFCTTPKLDGTDQCDVCMSGYSLHHDDGQCYFDNWTLIISVALIFAAVFTVVILWVIDLCCRSSVNDESVTVAEAWRSRSKIIDRRNRGIYGTWDTSLLDKDIAGPGMLLHFRFQLFFIVWPLCCALVWVALACFHNELFILGTRKFGTPRHNCILVAWGYETQQRLMWTKVLFLAIVYVGSFISFLWFSVNQLRTYQQKDIMEMTMKDYAVELKGLPPIPGKYKTVEEDIKEAVSKRIGGKGDEVVGVSVCWNYQGERQEDVENACAKDLAWRTIEYDMEVANKKRPSPAEVDKKVAEENALIKDEAHLENYGAMRKWMYNKEKALLGPDDEEEREMPRAEYDKKVKKMVEEMTSSDTCFVVFTTSDSRDKFLVECETVEFDCKKYKETAAVDKCTLTVTEVVNEPANINWHNFGEASPILNFFKGFFKVYVPALLIWFFGFYVPYAWSLYNFNYDNGAELPGYFSLIFTIIVCGGNATMYVVCDICCDIIGFRYKDTKQVTYMLMYLCACMINVFLDMVVTYYTAYKVMVGLDFRTYHGTRLADIDVFTEQFETYAMQRSLGENTYRYAWPSTFFLCFVLEPFVTIYFPYQIGKLIIRTHKEVRGGLAEVYLMAFEFDLGRYADILLNVFLGVLIFYFPGGYIWTLFFAMSFSHCFIYCFDHWRVINVIPCVKIVSMEVDWWAQVTMGFCCAVILSCLLFKANCESYAPYCLHTFGLVSVTSIAGTAHFIVHTLLIIYVVPKFGIDTVDNPKERTDFSAVAADEPRTWFAVNPVHCLRSKYIHTADYTKEKYCRYCYWGKEHLLEKNEKIGCHYFGLPADAPSFDVRKSISATFSKRKTVDDPQ